MAWNNGNSPWGSNRPGGPWGNPGGPAGGPQGSPPDFDAMIRDAQDKVKRMLPRGLPGGARGLSLLGLVVVGLWLASGFYRVEPDQQGVVLRFGAFDRVTQPGLNYHLPWPVETALTPRVTRVNRTDIGFIAAGDVPAGARPVPARDQLEESLMLTGDENIIDIDVSVFWRIREVGDYLFNARNVDQTIKSAAESTLREVIGRTPMQPALGEARAQIELAVRTNLQTIMDSYRAGVEISQVQLQRVDPPAAVIDAFRDVQRASADRERLRNEAEAYRNDIIPRARGEAERLVQEAQGFREAQVARATGEAQRFLSILTSFQAAREVTLARMYLETMEEILRRNRVIVVDDRLQGIMPFLPLDRDPAPRPAAGAAGGLPVPSSSAPLAAGAKPAGTR